MPKGGLPCACHASWRPFHPSLLHTSVLSSFTLTSQNLIFGAAWMERFWWQGLILEKTMAPGAGLPTGFFHNQNSSSTTADCIGRTSSEMRRR